MRASTCVALEATTNTWAVVRILRQFVTELAVGNPLKTRHIAEAHIKTDKVDAEVLAQLLRCNYLPRVWVPDEATSQLRELVARRTAFVAERTAIRNRIHSTLAMRLLAFEKRQLFGANGLAWLREMELDQQARLLIDCELRLHDIVDEQIAVLDEQLARRGYSDERVKLLMTLPGVKVAVAEALLAALGDVKRFQDADHAASYLGLVPKTRSSANRCYHGSITKAGNSQARWMLVQAAQHIGRHPGPLGHFFKKLAKKKNYNVAVVAAARKLATIAWHMLTKNEPYRYAVPTSTEAKLAKLRTKATGKRRQGGAPKGAGKPTARLPGGARRIKSLAEVYQGENLPPLPDMTPGEHRAVRESGTLGFVTGLDRAHLVPRKPRRVSNR